MPIYEYICDSCGSNHEIMQKITEEPLSTCPVCEGKLRKMISNTSFVLKGTGWYVTDYASNKNSALKTQSTDKQENAPASSTEANPVLKEPAVSSK